ncbi:MAG: hypothetical protein LBS96_00350, partial [Oscillospiraceae bacterium]|nr:hypothetical protein [Oscillospiraceae bacterium]
VLAFSFTPLLNFNNLNQNALDLYNIPSNRKSLSKGVEAKKFPAVMLHRRGDFCCVVVFYLFTLIQFLDKKTSFVQTCASLTPRLP